MMTRDILRAEMKTSEAEEEKIYKELTVELFRELQEPLKDLFEQALTATEQFTAITAAVLKEHPKIIKTLRYCLAPTISQMRLGQLIGLSTTEAFEGQGAVPSDDQAKRLARWFNNYLDRERFPWLDNHTMMLSERGLAESYAKLWTVSLQSNQNTLTKYRTQRKERQEKAIAKVLEGMGLKLQEKPRGTPGKRPQRKPVDPPKPRRTGGIDDVEDVQPGHYVKEKKILGASQKKQKADLTARPDDEPSLFCIEAKAVGIKLDSTKRLKELNDKYTDWKGSGLPITTVGVVAGMFSGAELVATIKQRKIPIFFEHDLAKLVEFLRSRRYYGIPWNPDALFPEVSETELAEALEKIQTAPVDADAQQQSDTASDEE